MIEIIDNIFSEEERKKLIDLSQPLLVPSERFQASAFENGYPRKFYPGKQSFPTVHLHPDFQYYFNHIVELVNSTGIRVKIKEAWVNYHDAPRPLNWHIHFKEGSDYCVIYYMKTNWIDSGTVFRDKFVKVPQNSLLLFPCHLEHSVPRNLLRLKRYTLAIDLTSI